MEIKDHTVDISSNQQESTPSQAHSVAHDQQTSVLMAACSSHTSTGTVATPIIAHQPSNSENNKHNNPTHDDDDLVVKAGCRWKLSRLVVEIIIIIMLLVVISFLIVVPLAMVVTSIIIPVIIICLVLGYWITCLHQFAICDDYADIDDVYDTDLGSYWHHLIRWMAQLTGVLIAELMVYLALFRFGPFPLRKLSLVHLPIWKWFLIGIIFLIYFVLWCLIRILLHQVREKSSFGRVAHVFPIYEALLGVAIWGFYFLVEWFIFKLVPPLRRPKILGLYAHKWVHALVYVFIGVNVSRLLSASIVALLQKHHEHQGMIDSSLNKDKESASTRRLGDKVNSKDPSKIPQFMAIGCKLIMGLLFRHFDTKKCIMYVVVGLRRSINFVLISIWLLVTWTSHFEHQLKPSKDTVWVLRVGTATLTCLLIFAVLWLVKNSIMLWWKYRSMYNKIYDQGLEAGIKLYLLGMICGQHLDILRIGSIIGSNSSDVEKIKKGADQKNNSNKKRVAKKYADQESTNRKRIIKRVAEKARKILVHDLNKADHEKENQLMPDIYAIMRMVKYFIQAENLFKKDINASIQKIMERWHQAHSHYDEISRSTPLDQKHIKVAYGTKLTDDDDSDAQKDDDSDAKKKAKKIRSDRIQKGKKTTFDILHNQIVVENPGKPVIDLQDFERWMERSYRSCFNRVSTLASEQRLADYLDRVMIVAIILTTFGIWLCMVTRSTQIVALLAAPLIALSFMIGDTCSAVFKGIIFSYVIHPYDIGDLCIIQGTLYEVKQMDFWGTTFLKVDTNEVVFYPNSTLFGESIINKKSNEGGLVALDRVEFSLESVELSLERDTDKKKIEVLKKKIEDLKKKIDDCLKGPYTKWQKQQMDVNYEIGKPINVTIHFKHDLKDFRGVSNFEYLQEMKKNKQDLQLTIMEWCADMNIKPAMGKSG